MNLVMLSQQQNLLSEDMQQIMALRQSEFRMIGNHHTLSCREPEKLPLKVVEQFQCDAGPLFKLWIFPF